MDALERIYIDDTAYGEFGTRNMVERIKEDCPNVELIIIDYIQLLGASSIQWIYDAFPDAAVLVLGEVSRAVEERESHIVKYNDINNIEQIGQYFETIFSVYRDDYYNFFEKPNNLITIYNLKSRFQRFSYTFIMKEEIIDEYEPPMEDINE